jgi:hypothetical protein
LRRESLTYGTEYIQTKYRCFERLKESSYAEKTFAVFPTLVFGGTLNKRSKYPVSYLTSGLKEINKWLCIARFLKLDSKFHFIHANDIAQICGFLIKNHKEDNYKGFKKFVLGQNFISIDDAINILLKSNGMNRYFSIPLTKTIMKILLRVLPIQMTPWDSFSIKKYDFNHVPITNPEKLNLKSYARSLQDVLRLAKLLMNLTVSPVLIVTELGSKANIPASVPSLTSTVLAETEEIPRPKVKTIAKKTCKD